MRRGFSTIILVVVMLVSGVVKGQDPQFSQFYAAQLYLNPAFTGSTQISRAGINYRNQWPAIDASYVTRRGLAHSRGRVGLKWPMCRRHPRMFQFGYDAIQELTNLEVKCDLTRLPRSR